MTMLITSAFYMLTIVVGIFCLRSLRQFERSIKDLNEQVESLDNLLALNFDTLKDRIEGHIANDFQEVKHKVIKHTAVKDYQQDEVNEFVLANIKDWIHGEGYLGDWEVDDKISEAIANIDFADEAESAVRNLHFTVSVD